MFYHPQFHEINPGRWVGFISVGDMWEWLWKSWFWWYVLFCAEKDNFGAIKYQRFIDVRCGTQTIKFSFKIEYRYLRNIICL